jgi:hypothetical protein
LITKRDIEKKDYQNYLDRWRLVKEVEENEMRQASFELQFKQTLAIWDIGKALNFTDSKKPSNYMWADLQNKWIISNARK